MLKFLAISSLFFVACAADNQPMMPNFEHLDSQMIADIYVYVEFVATQNTPKN